MDGRFQKSISQYFFDDRIRFFPVLLGMILLAHPISSRFFLPRPNAAGDSLSFQLIGWEWIFVGNVPYVHRFALKPPAIYEFTALVNLLTGGNRFFVHAVGVIVSSLIVVGTLVLSIELTYKLTDDVTAALVTGFVPLTLARFYEQPSAGISVKLFVGILALFTIYFYVVDRPFLLGASSALAASFWQPAFLLPVVSLSLIRYEHGSSTTFRRVLAGVLGTTILVTLPLLLSDAVVPMVVESILHPMTKSEPFDPVSTIRKFRALVGFVWILPFVSLVGSSLLIVKTDAIDANTWVLAILCVFVVQLFLLDFDGTRDLIALYAVSGIGIGSLSHWLSLREKSSIIPTVIAISLLILVLINTPVMSGGFTQSYNPNGPIDDTYWEGEIADDCYGVYVTNYEKKWQEVSGVEPGSRKCWRAGTSSKVLSVVT